MALWKYERDKDGFFSREPLKSYSPQTLVEAREKFTLLKNKGVILSEYTDDVWVLSKQTRMTHCDFGKDKNSLSEVCNQDNVPYDHFIDALKCFVLLCLGACQLEDMTTLVSTVITETIKSRYYSRLIPVKKNISIAGYYVDFVFLIAPHKKLYIKTITRNNDILRYKKYHEKAGSHSACALCEFDSVFVYDDILRTWWDSEASQSKKAFFYPLYLFWTITTILPLRVNEFCFTSFDCLSQRSNRYYITVRRSRLKGNHQFLPKLHDYSLEKDYYLKTYEIPEKIYRDIETYKIWSKDYHRNYNLLFSLEFLYENNTFYRRKSFYRTSVFDSYYLGWIQKMFYNHIIAEVYGYRIITAQEIDSRSNQEGVSYGLNDNEIMMILPRYTRHLAMINLVLRGCNPVMVKEFAGHANETVSAHYYTNYSNLTRTTVMRLHEKQLHNESASKYYFNPAISAINQNSDFRDMDLGRCYSHNFINGNISDCSECSGECRFCKFFIPYKKDGYEELRSIVDDEFEFISKLLKNPKIDKALMQIKLQQYYKLETNLASIFWQEVQNEST